jgi:hypothetical protein
MDYSPRGTGSIGLPKLRRKDQSALQRNETDRKGPNLDNNDDDDLATILSRVRVTIDGVWIGNRFY